LKEDLIGFKSGKHKLSRVFPDVCFNSKANDLEDEVVQKTKITFFVMLILRFAS
jgi:hypothetical protein